MIQYIFTKKLGVSVQDLAIVDNVGGILYYIAFLSFINKLKGVPLWKLFILGNLSNLAMLFEFAPFFDFPNWLQLVIRFCYGMVSRLGSEMYLMPLMGRINKYLPEGFESTGVVIIVSMSNFTGTTGSRLGAHQQAKFEIKNGHYDRGLPLLVLNYAIKVGLVILAPIFLAWG